MTTCPYCRNVSETEARFCRFDGFVLYDASAATDTFGDARTQTLPFDGEEATRALEASHIAFDSATTADAVTAPQTPTARATVEHRPASPHPHVRRSVASLSALVIVPIVGAGLLLSAFAPKVASLDETASAAQQTEVDIEAPRTDAAPQPVLTPALVPVQPSAEPTTEERVPAPANPTDAKTQTGSKPAPPCPARPATTRPAPPLAEPTKPEPAKPEPTKPEPANPATPPPPAKPRPAVEPAANAPVRAQAPSPKAKKEDEPETVERPKREKRDKPEKREKPEKRSHCSSGRY